MEVERCQPRLPPGLVLGHRQDHVHGCWSRLRAGERFRDTDPPPENAEHGLSDLVGGGRLHCDRERGSLAGYPSPRTTKIDPSSGAVITQVMGSPLVWGGMPTVDFRDSARIAFAGQWIGSQTVYNQDRNYIWLIDASWQIEHCVAPVRPLDPQANAKGAFRPEFQGRAPWFSPDGKWVAFESAHADPKNEFYTIFIQSAQGDGPARQVTDIKWNANHAKFYPDGERLVATLLQEPGGERRGIAMLDVSEFVIEAA
jgi:hypothetical protein